MKCASDAGEDVEHRMHIAAFFCKSVEYCSDTVHNTSYKHKHASLSANTFLHSISGKNNTPAHGKIADHRKFTVFFYVDRIKYDPDSRRHPTRTEYRPSDNGIILSDVTYRYRSLRSGYKNEDGTMIKFLKYVFCSRHVNTKTVIYA